MEKYKELAENVIDLAQTRLLSNLRFLSSALMAVRYEAFEQKELLATDGRVIYYNSRLILEAFQTKKDSISAALQHVLFHCLMGHPFENHEKDIRIWNLACDMAAELVCAELAGKRVSLAGGKGIKFGFPDDWEAARYYQLQRFNDYAGGSTAQKFYNYFVDNEVSEEEIAELEILFVVDSHRFWITGGSQKRKLDGLEKHKKTDGMKMHLNALTEDEDAQLQMQSRGEEWQEFDVQKKKKQWKRIAGKVQTELELFQTRQGYRAGSLMAGMARMLFEQVDYSQFLRIFATENEVMHISDEEFDLTYYTYGLQKYGNLPLIEPLEYSNINRIREFVIAIDTSGSVQGEIVEEFLRKTCSVLRQTESFTDRVCIYVVQCDAQIQQYTEITDLDDLERYIQELQIYGFGGTDFRPVFEFVDQLLEEKKIRKLNGLIYFTDGVGIYPKQEPEYKTAFIFYREDYLSPQVPEWGIRAVLTGDSIRVVREKL